MADKSTPWWGLDVERMAYPESHGLPDLVKIRRGIFRDILGKPVEPGFGDFLLRLVCVVILPQTMEATLEHVTQKYYGGARPENILSYLPCPEPLYAEACAWFNAAPPDDAVLKLSVSEHVFFVENMIAFRLAWDVAPKTWRDRPPML